MKRMFDIAERTRWLIGFFLIVLMPATAIAEPSDEAMKVVKIFSWADRIHERVTIVFPEWSELTEEQREKFEETTEYGKAALETKLAEVIDREMELEDLKEIVRFLESDEGRKFVDKIFRDPKRSEMESLIGAWAIGRYEEMNEFLEEKQVVLP